MSLYDLLFKKLFLTRLKLDSSVNIRLKNAFRLWKRPVSEDGRRDGLGRQAGWVFRSCLAPAATLPHSILVTNYTETQPIKME